MTPERERLIRETWRRICRPIIGRSLRVALQPEACEPIDPNPVPIIMPVRALEFERRDVSCPYGQLTVIVCEGVVVDWHFKPLKPTYD